MTGIRRKGSTGPVMAAWGRVRRRQVLAGLAALPALGRPALAQRGFPDRPIRLVVPYGPGTATDAVARQVSANMQALLGHPMVVENRAGANGIPGTQAVTQSGPDGLTLLFANDQVACLGPVLFSRLPYDFARSFVPVAGIATVSYVLVVTPGVPARSVAELVALAKAQPGRLSFGSTAVGSGAHLLGEVFARDAGIDLLHVPYSAGATQLFGDLMTGRVSMLFYPFQGVKAQLESGQLRALATTGTQRPDWMPDLPTLHELGYRRATFTSWFAVYAPAAVGEERIARLSDAFRTALENPNLRTSFRANGVSIAPRGPAELGAFTASESTRCRQLVEISGARVE
jgi:tripartite-type tricarboxylate transporter receptor subunit TctC